MGGYLPGHVAHLTDEGKAQMVKLVAALSAEAKLPDQAELDQQATDDGTLDEGRTFMSEPLDASDEAEGYSCTDCHKFGEEGELGSAPDLTGYGSEEWLIGIISNPEHERFYEGTNDRMPAFHSVEGESPSNRLSSKDVRLIARWLRGDDKDLGTSH